MSALHPSAQTDRLCDVKPWVVIAIGMAVMYASTFHGLATRIWVTDEQGHGPIVLALIAWLLWRDREHLRPIEPSVRIPTGAWVLIVFGILIYLLGRQQRLLSAQMVSAISVVAGSIWLLCGRGVLKRFWFPVFFMLFLVPLPALFVDLVTQPLKLGASTMAAQLLYTLGYPVARSGVILQVGQYQMLVADACAGLHTLFTLEAMGLLYLNLVRTASLFRNVTLALMIVPISFMANVIRVMSLCLVTYHLGDEAGQGFLHGFAGMVLFLSALLLIIFFDSMLRRLKPAAPATP